MQQLYSNLAKATTGAPVTKAEALRQAQIALITGNYTVLGEQRGALGMEQ